MTLRLFQSGAKINISDGSCPERIVTVTGNTESIFKAFTLICNKFEEVSFLQPKTIYGVHVHPHFFTYVLVVWLAKI